MQDKLSAEMISSQVATTACRFILKLDPPAYPHLVRNEIAHLAAARELRIPVSESSLVSDARGDERLLVRRFDRRRLDDGTWERRALEDATQVLGLPPADKYRVAAETAVLAMAERCSAPLVAVRNLYLQFVFAWLTGNGDLHAKNIAMLAEADGRFTVAPVYDVPGTLVYGDDSLALPVAGRTTRLKARHWRDFAEAIGLRARAAASAHALAVGAASRIRWDDLPFEGPPVRATVRELGFRRAELEP